MEKIDLTEMIIAKALQSKQDGRMATFKSVEQDGTIVLDMEKLGERKFSQRTVEQGFVDHLDNESLVDGFVRRHVDRTDLEVSDEKCFDMSCKVYDLMSRRFKDLTNVECYKAIRGIFDED